MLSAVLIWSLARFWGSLALFIYVLINDYVLGGDFLLISMSMPGFL